MSAAIEAFRAEAKRKRGDLSADDWIAKHPGKHLWATYDRLELCAFCMKVRRSDDKNRPCRGIARVGPRATPLPPRRRGAMSLDVYLTKVQPTKVFSANITHNLGRMAKEAGLYECLWRPEEVGVTKAAQLIEPLRAGIARMKADPGRFEAHNAPNGWGLYEHFVPRLEQYLAACEEHPDADVSVWR